MLANRKNDSILGTTKLRLPTVDSTNNYAANLLKEQLLGHGTVILADEQTNGRGQRGSVWQSEPGKNLQFSLVIFPDQLAIADQRYLNSFVSLSLVEFLKKLGLAAKIKWPNDILVNSKKIAGVLIENQLKSDGIQSSIIGIGFNINQLNFDNLNATSLAVEMNCDFRLNEVLDSLLHQMNSTYELMKSNRFSDLETAYYQNLWGYRELKKFQDDQGFFEGIIQGISPEGLLMINVENESQRTYDIKELTFLLEEE
jgi:BirA family transcriptional regulator, biotin operon repressor / biotin---[acetyl-CoA-carboxylase] ligase